MSITRRQFLKYCISSAASIGLTSSLLANLSKTLATPGAAPTIIWIEGASCSGCSVALSDLIGNCADNGPTDFGDLFFNYINAAFAKTFMTAAGDLAVSSLRAAQQNEYILVVEGGIPTAFNGMACTLFSENGVDVTMKDAVQELALKAKSIICVGSCSSYGGIPASGENPTGIQTVTQCTGASTINLPGCPAHPDWVAATIAKLLCGEELVLDDTDNRPIDLYQKTVHYTCPRRPLYDLGSFATKLGQEGKCYYQLGCRGPYTIADCSARGWNSGFNYCIQANSPCIGCAEKTFPRTELIKL